MQIIGCGHRERGDDAAGVLVVEKLRELGVESTGASLRTCSGEATELMEGWSADDEVIIVDAVVTGAPVGTVHCWQGDLPAAAGSSPASTHGFGVHEAIRLAQALGRVPRSLRIYGIEAGQFATGGVLSAEVQRAVLHVTGQIRTEIVSSAAPA